MEGFLKKSVNRILVFVLTLSMIVPLLSGCSSNDKDDSKNYIFALTDLDIPNPPMSMMQYTLYPQQNEVLLMGAEGNGGPASIEMIYLTGEGTVGDRFSLKLGDAQAHQICNLYSGDKYILCWTNADVSDAEEVVYEDAPIEAMPSEDMSSLDSDMEMPDESADMVSEDMEMPDESADVVSDDMEMPDESAGESFDEFADMNFDAPMEEEPPAKTFENGYHLQLVRLDRNGKVIKQKNLSNDSAMENFPDVTQEYVFNRIVANKDTVALFSQEVMAVYDSELNFVKAYKLAELDKHLKNANFFLDNTDKVFVAYCDAKQFVHLAEIDLRTGHFDDGVKIPNAKYYIDLRTGVDSQFILNMNNSLLRYNSGDEEFTKIVDFAASSVPTNYVNNYAGIDSQHYVIVYNSISDNMNHLGFLSKVDPKDVVEKTTLTLATMFPSPNIQKAVYNFNTTHSDICISILDYNAMYGADVGGTYETALDKLNTDIVSGNMPDILVLNSNIPINTYVGKGLLEDLYPFIESDHEFSLDDFNTHVWDVFAKDGKLYTLVPFYTVNTFAIKKSFLKGHEKWTLEEALKVQKENNVRYFFSLASKSQVIDNCLRMAGSQFVDMDKAECRFNSDEFKEILEFASTFPDQSNYEKAEKELGSFDTWYRKNQVLMCNTFISSFPTYLSLMRGYYGDEEIALVGFPSIQGGISSFDCDTKLAMSAKSEHQAEIWEFMRNFLTDEFQTGSNNYSIPISNKAFDSMIEQAKQPLFNEWSFDGIVQREPMKYYYNGEEYDVKPFTDAEAEEMVRFINSVNSTSEVDQKIMTILKEESGEYFNENATLDEVCNRIQSRVQIYLYEIQ